MGKKEDNQKFLEKKIVQHKAKIGIIGLGYVGLPLAVEFSKAGFAVTGIEIDKDKVRMINRGECYIRDVKQSELEELVKNNRLEATQDFSVLKDMDAIIICVPTPLRKTKDPDISYIMAAGEEIAKNLHKGQLIVLESTTYPGTTREIILPKLARRKFREGKDFYLAFSPERTDPGNKIYTIRNTPKIVGGITKKCTSIAVTLYEQIIDEVVPVSSTESAEMVKLLENTFRIVNVGLINEIALICDKLKLDTWEVIDAAATKPFGFMPFYPGPGLGGHCVPIDPHYLSWKLKALNFYARFIELAGEINIKMPEFLVSKIDAALNEREKSIKGSRILILGIAYKSNVADARESPALDVIRLLKERGGRVVYNDPYVPQVEGLKSIPLTESSLRNADCVVITTDHSVYDYKQIVKNAKLVIDSRNATKGIRDKKIVKL
ncbi:MAG: nucleotide sugar dehydrogenase [Elusimicrobiota bacterium]|nr:nucleotide sugar dehydrogenase [Elusimicrobiota bacterium]MDH5661486.1 nucleotide sugar dehydrogenase [Elusimicrobiota bacterium]